MTLWLRIALTLVLSDTVMLWRRLRPVLLLFPRVTRRATRIHPRVRITLVAYGLPERRWSSLWCGTVRPLGIKVVGVSLEERLSVSLRSCVLLRRLSCPCKKWHSTFSKREMQPDEAFDGESMLKAICLVYNISFKSLMDSPLT